MQHRDVLARLKNIRRSGQGWIARCPAHDDKQASLSVGTGDGGRVLLKCHAGCSFEAILAALNLSAKDVFDDVQNTHPQAAQPQKRRIVATYDYCDEAGKLLYQAVRYEPKGFAQRRPDGNGGWLWNLQDTRRVLYRLPEIKGDVAFLVEGEKDADRLKDLGLVATSNVCGAGKWRAEYNEPLRDKHIVVLPDNDEPGRKHAEQVAASLQGVARSVCVVVLPDLPAKGDISDWLNNGGTVETLRAIAKATPVWKPETAQPVNQLVPTAQAAQVEPQLPEPEPLPADLLPVPAIDKALLPTPFFGWLTDIAERMQCPLEFPAVAAVVAVAGIVGNRAYIQPKRHDSGWQIFPNLWGAIVGRPGVLKTPAMLEPLAPLVARERQAAQEYDDSLKTYLFDETWQTAQKAALKAAMQKKGAKKADLREQFDALNLPEPKRTRYIVNDSTIEKLGVLLNENPRGLLLVRDELVGWFRSLDRDGREQDRTFFLEAWSGTGSFTFDRIARGTLTIKNLTVSVLGGIQPEPLRQYLRAALRGGVGDDGLMQRFQLMVYPDITGDWHNIDRSPDSQAASLAHECFARLDNLKETSQPLQFDNAAQEFFDSWRADLERSLRNETSQHPALESHFSKYRSLMPSLALLFHLLDGTESGVSLANAERAAAWCSFLSEHAKRIYGLGVSGDVALARAILLRIRKGDLPDRFTARELYRKRWAGLAEAEDVAKPLALLCDYGYLIAMPGQPSSGGGRPSPTYLAHPSIAPESGGTR